LGSGPQGHARPSMFFLTTQAAAELSDLRNGRRTMKAIRVRQFGGPEVLQLEDLPNLRPQRGEVVIRVRAAGVNPVDTYMRSGNYGANNPKLPYTPGSDAAGIVEAIGADVEGISTGDRVFTTDTTSGAYSELVVCKREQVIGLPEQVSFSQGAGVYVPYATAYRGLVQLAQAKPGETLLVHGASGGVGIAALQFARAMGMVVIGTAGSDKGLTLVEREGAHFAINHRVPNYQQHILDLTKGRGVDVILEMLANVNLGNDLRMLAQRGRVVVIGSRGDVQITPRDIMAREATVLGVFHRRAPQPELEAIRAALHAGLSNSTLSPRIAVELPLSAAPEAHQRVMQPGASGKIVLIP
jgi:NADPH:quinone reductase